MAQRLVTPMLIPPVMPRAGTVVLRGGKNADYYEISMRQFRQQILPAGMASTTVWGYGAVAASSKKGLLLHHAPSLTIEARVDRPVRVKWINDLRDEAGNYLPHLLAVDPPCTGPTHPAGRPARHPPQFQRDPGSLHGAGADGHPCPWRGGGG